MGERVRVRGSDGREGVSARTLTPPSPIGMGEGLSWNKGTGNFFEDEKVASPQVASTFARGSGVLTSKTPDPFPR